ncbi:TolC family protein [Gaopeijia maritima]|uniref:TolC family protein n=1 Tax=Gaopeijia maritima TaxID=3119007 RepID=UPI00328A56CC
MGRAGGFVRGLGAVGVAWTMGVAASAPASASVMPAQTAQADTIEMTLNRMIDLALGNSFRIQQVNLNIERTRLRLKAERARLRSRVDLELSAPTLRAQSEPRFDTQLGTTRTFRENSNRYQGQLSVRQPVILFGFPTNGYISLNNRMHRFEEEGTDGEVRTEYFNEYFVRYTQPLFQPNNLKNDIEGAELDLEDSELDFYADVVSIIDQSSRSYLDLFRNASQRQIRARYVERLETALELASLAAQADPTRSIEVDQVNVELANAREQLQQAQSQFRLETSGLKTEYNLPQSAEITIDPVMVLDPVPIDLERAAQLAVDLTPRMRRLGIQLRESEISVEQTKGRGGVQVDFSVSYGTEKRDEYLSGVWEDPENSFSLDLEAAIPIWDWGERSARIQASEVGVRQTQLRIEQAILDIRTGIENEVRNVDEYQSRALAMQQTQDLATSITEQSLGQYAEGTVSVLDLLQTLRREVDTANTSLDTYLGWRRALLRLQQMTYYDFERDIPILDRYGIDFESTSPT